nr:MAG TPA: hypothetical protein [Caudoviricetes sp.]
MFLRSSSFLFYSAFANSSAFSASYLSYSSASSRICFILFIISLI